MSKKVLIVGNVGSGLMVTKIAEIQAKNPDMEVVTIEEAKERGLSQTFEITDPPKLNFTRSDFKPPLTRAERRKNQRKKLK